MGTIELGPTSLLEETPVELTVDGGRYVLHERSDESIVLYSAVCPHQRGRISAKDDVFVCPNHRWKFDPETGRCLTVEGESLPWATVSVEGGSLYADPPE